MKLLKKLIIIGFLVGILALIRSVEYQFFYDPFMYFFSGGGSGAETEYPKMLFFNVFLRFLLNTLISLAILWVAFRKSAIIKFSALLYTVFFVVLFPIFVYLMHHVSPGDYLAAFYVRRFLVHPVLILLLLPAFYYYRLRRPSEE